MSKQASKNVLYHNAVREISDRILLLGKKDMYNLDGLRKKNRQNIQIRTNLSFFYSDVTVQLERKKSAKT